MTNVDRPTSGSAIAGLRRLGSFRELGILVALALLCAFFWWKNPGVFTKPANWQIIMRFVATFGILAIGEIFVIITGGIDLSVGSMTALTGVLVAWLMVKGVGGVMLGMIPAILIVLLLSACVGLWHGFFVTRVGVPAFIITLGTWLIASGVAAYVTRGYPIVFDSGHPFLVLGQEEFHSIPIMFIIMVVVALCAVSLLNLTTLGRHIYAVGGNREAARVSGVKIRSGAPVLLCRQQRHGRHYRHPVGLAPGTRHPGSRIVL